MNLCTGCLKTFKNYQLGELIGKNYVIALCKECNGDIVEVDELICPTIIELNKKGWKTAYCCSGHLDEKLIGSYIKFEHHPHSAPYGFYISGDCIYLKDAYRSLTGLNGFQELMRINKNLYSWALRLPERTG